MIDAICLLLERAPFDYAKAAGIWLLAGRKRGALTDTQSNVSKVAAIENESKLNGRRPVYSATGIIIALIIGPVFVFGVYTILTSMMSL